MDLPLLSFLAYWELVFTRYWEAVVVPFGCPMAAILDFNSAFSHAFALLPMEAMISCGNCSTYCEMGIDVRAYAQRQNIVRSSCVGCGICSTVCPRGVLKLENGPVAHRTSIPISQ